MATEKRLIKMKDATAVYNGIALYMAENAYLNDTALDVLKMVAEWLNKAPTVDAVEVVHGRWIRKPIGKYTGVDEVCCSICGCFLGVVASDTAFREAIEGMNYCPNCGADMRGDGNG